MTTDDLPNTTDPVVKVARHLSEIIDLDHALFAQAVNNAGAKVDGTVLPGGLAMVALAPVASMEAWEHQYEAREHLARSDAHGRDVSHVEDEDDTWEPPLQTVRFWSDRYRRERDAEWDHIPTIATEAGFLRRILDWIWEHEEHWDHFARDVRRARTRMENLLTAGERPQRGVPCMYEECRGARLERKLVPKRGPEGQKVWDFSDWRCPRCHRTWNEDRYWSNVAAANERAQREDIGDDAWCSVGYAARVVGRPVKTVRTWIDRGQVATACIILGRRTKFVRLADVQARHEEAEGRAKKQRERITTV